ncbi:STAS domain-containing protein [Falsirhodobacter sp. 1013]|uniref:STAS domain-containing protein n=1 Tax=Falsirhodobacter sp. 1013 TaxID=3417566 RepID=UPI003EBE5851
MITTDTHGQGICLVNPNMPRLTAATATAFKDEVAQMIDQGYDKLVIDLGDVSFVDSSGLGALVGLLKKVGNRGEIILCQPADSVMQMFRITRMDRVFKFLPDRAQALDALNAG